MKFKKAILSIIAIAIVLAFIFIIFNGKNYKSTSLNKINIVSSNFASYDFLRAIIGDNNEINLTFLIGPGKDAHSFEPTAKDLITIQNADLFVYVGGEMEQWANKVLGAIDTKKTKNICISEFVETVEERKIDGAQEDDEHNHSEQNTLMVSDHEHTQSGAGSIDQQPMENINSNNDTKFMEEANSNNDYKTVENTNNDNDNEHTKGAFDEHIWTSPKNAIKMIQTLERAVEEIDSKNATQYKNNAQNYIKQVQEVDKEIQEIVDNRVRDRLIFADRMPMQYFINYYGLQVSSAFSACSTDVEPSTSTIAYLENKVRDENIPVVLHIELNDGTLAKTIAEGAKIGAEVMQIQTLHNISLDDFKNKETWVSLMKRNMEVLKKALW